MARWQIIALVLIVVLALAGVVALSTQTKAVPLFSSWGYQIGYLAIPSDSSYSECKIISKDIWRQVVMAHTGKDPYDNYFSRLVEKPLQARCQ